MPKSQKEPIIFHEVTDQERKMIEALERLENYPDIKSAMKKSHKYDTPWWRDEQGQAFWSDHGLPPFRSI